MQVFSFCFYTFFFCVSVGEEGVQGLAEKEYVQSVPGRGSGSVRAEEGTLWSGWLQPQDQSAMWETPSQESAFL